MEIYKLKFSVGLLSLVLFSAAHATVITTDFTYLSGNSWQAEYTIENDTLGFDIDEFAIYFDVGLYENLSIVSTPVDWDPLLLQPDSALPDDGVYDVLALTDGIAAGSLLSGFVVSFNWLGAAMPGRQHFEIIDPVPFVVLDSGLTTLAGGVPVPEAGTMMLLLLGFGVMALICTRRKSFILSKYRAF